jgi:hypothetical protein
MIRASGFANGFRTILLLVSVLQAGLGCGGDDSGEAESAARGTRGENGEQAIDASVTPSLPDETAGKGCTNDDECAPGMCLTAFAASGGGMMEAPGGYCSSGCMTNAECGTGGTCSGAFAGFGGIGAMAGRCLKGCGMDADCREGYRCVTALGMSVTSGAQDPTGGLLGASGCEPIPETQKLADGVVGTPCDKHSDCGDGRCQRGGAMGEYPGGYCTGACLVDADCGASGVCTPPTAAGAGSCSLRCEQDTDCRDGYRCRTVSGQLQCVAGAEPLPDGVVGLDCDADADCGGGAMTCASRLGETDTVGGYCTQKCVDATDCGTDGACVGSLPAELPAELAGLLGSMSTCYRACSADADCRKGYVCQLPMGLFGAAGTQTVCVVGSAVAAEEDAGVGAP